MKVVFKKICLINIFMISGLLIGASKHISRLRTGNALNLEQLPEIITS